jgi:hypothetical protein
MSRIGRDERLADDEGGGGDQDVHVSGRLPLLLEQRGDPGEQPRRFGSKLQEGRIEASISGLGATDDGAGGDALRLRPLPSGSIANWYPKGERAGRGARKEG